MPKSKNGPPLEDDAMRSLIIPTLVTIALSALATFSQVNEKCIHRAWITDTDPKGLNVRQKPAASAKVIGKIPFARDEGQQTIVEITGYSNGWLRIRSAESVDGDVSFQGIGWISSKMATVNTERPDGNSSKPVTLFSLPDRRSKKAGTIPSDVLPRLIGYDCFGFKVEYKGKAGWLSAGDMCGNPVTTCP